MCCYRASIYFVFFQILALVLFVLGVLMGQFRPLMWREDSSEKGCLTFFGLKPTCFSSYDTLADLDDFFQECDQRSKIFKGAQATVFVTAAMFVASVIIGCLLIFMPMYLYRTVRGFALGVGVIGTCSCGVTWALMVVSFFLDIGNNPTEPQCQALKKHYDYGIGFGFVVAAWAIHTLNLFIAMLPCM